RGPSRGGGGTALGGWEGEWVSRGETRGSAGEVRRAVDRGVDVDHGGVVDLRGLGILWVQVLHRGGRVLLGLDRRGGRRLRAVLRVEDAEVGPQGYRGLGRDQG